MTNTVPSVYSREAARDDFTLNIEAYYLKDWQGYDMPLHSHNRMEIMYVLSGRCTIKTGEKELNLKKNEFILLDAAVPHGLLVEEGATCRIMNIEFSMGRKNGSLSLRAAVEKYPPLKRFLSEARPYLVFIDSEDVHSMLRRLINCLDGTEEGLQFEIGLLQIQLLLAIARMYDEGSGIGRSSQIYVRRAMQFMSQNYYREIGMKDISAHTGVAEGHLSRMFKKSTGETVIDHLTKLRIRKAKMLLGKTELPIIDISGYVGVASRQYFNQLFKKHTGITPGQYRRAAAHDEQVVTHDFQ